MDENKDPHTDEQLIARFGAELRERTAVDEVTRARLARARAQAVAAVPDPQLGRGPMLPMALAAALLMMVSVGLRDQHPAEAPVPEVLASAELLTGEDDLGMLGDLEFYAWLESQPEFQEAEALDPAAGPGGSGGLLGGSAG